MTTSSQERRNDPARPSAEQGPAPEKERLPAPNLEGPLRDEPTDEELLRLPRVSGSSNREGGHDMHPHPGDHGEAQRRGSPRQSDYDGET
jgi:hypothetical protein